MDYETVYDATHRLLWGFLTPKAEPSFTLGLLTALDRHDLALHRDEGLGLRTARDEAIDYYVWASRHREVFGLGGDLAHFIACIEQHDRAALLQYATLCIDNVDRRLRHFDAQGLVTLSLVQGAALGGGFEAALASDVIIAEAHATFGFPEIRFNLFPGMGGYSLLCRRIGMRQTEEMMTSGRVYSAADCKSMGIIDRVVPTGTGQDAVHAYVTGAEQHHNGLAAIYAARRRALPVSHHELMAVTTQWVEAALRLCPGDLQHMRRLVQAQSGHRGERQ